MAKVKIPNAVQMQALKYGEAPEAEQDRVAEALRQAGRRAEALLLYERRPGHPQLKEEAAWAVAEGSGFHLLSVQRVGVEISEDEFRRCAAKAESAGRYLDARHCYVAIRDSEALARIADELPESLREMPEAEGPDDSAS